jgi:hypothetical protein
MRMFWRKEEPTGFNPGVCGLHHDLRCGEVAPDEDVQVRNLGKRGGHGRISGVASGCARERLKNTTHTAGNGSRENALAGLRSAHVGYCERLPHVVFSKHSSRPRPHTSGEDTLCVGFPVAPY